MRQRWLGGLVVGVAVLVAGLSASAQTNVLFILDASGSMKEAAGAESKIVAAKRVMKTALNDMPKDARLGLMLYGHRRAKDCTDIELVSPIGADDAATIASTIEKVNPRGETPIAKALEQAARSFAAFKGQRNYIVLVTDGNEECKGNPCAAAEAISKAGLDLKVDVVGFNLGAKERQDVQCIVEKTGGKYYDAKDAGGLTAAMGEVKKEVAQAAPASAAPTAPAKPNLLLASNGGQVVAAPNEQWKSTIDGKEDSIRELSVGSEAIYAFKDDRPATFDTFTALIPDTGDENLKDFELLVADSLNGPFRSIGTFSAQNVRLMRTPYQEFKFEPVTAKYLKVKLLSRAAAGVGWIRLYEFQLFGTLAEAAASPASAAPRAPAKPNLLLASNGGQVLAAPNEQWKATIDGKEDSIRELSVGSEAIYAFKDERPATFDTFATLVPDTFDENLKDFELLVADSLNGPFRSIGTFSAQNVRLMRTPYQEFKFEPVTAKYLKVKLLSRAAAGVGWIRLYEFQLFGTLQ